MMSSTPMVFEMGLFGCLAGRGGDLIQKLQRANSKGSRGGFVGQVVSGRPGVPRPKNHTQGELIQKLQRGNSKGSRGGFWAKWFLGGLGYQGQNNRIFSKKIIAFLENPGSAKGDAYCQLSSHFSFKFFGLDQELATEWPYNCYTGLILGAFCIIFASLTPFKGVLGPTLAKNRRKTAKN
jgi:hypothetical protein